MNRPFTTIAVYPAHGPIKSVAFYIITTLGNMRQIRQNGKIARRDIKRPATLEQKISAHMADSNVKVCIDVCNAEFKTVQRMEYTRP